MAKSLDEFKKEILNIGTIKKIPDSDPDMNDDYLLLSLLSNYTKSTLKFEVN